MEPLLAVGKQPVAAAAGAGAAEAEEPALDEFRAESPDLGWEEEEEAAAEQAIAPQVRWALFLGGRGTAFVVRAHTDYVPRRWPPDLSAKIGSGDPLGAPALPRPTCPIPA